MKEGIARLVKNIRLLCDRLHHCHSYEIALLGIYKTDGMKRFFVSSARKSVAIISLQICKQLMTRIILAKQVFRVVDFRANRWIIERVKKVITALIAKEILLSKSERKRNVSLYS